VTSSGNVECFKKSFTMVFQMLLCGECYENVYTERRTNYPSFNTLKYINPATCLQKKPFYLLRFGVKLLSVVSEVRWKTGPLG
jgi:hypothetical protein